MTNITRHAESLSPQAGQPVTKEESNKGRSMVERTKRLIAPILVISSLTSTAAAQVSPPAAPVENKEAKAQPTTAPSAPVKVEEEGATKFSGVASTGIQYVSTGYRKGSNLKVQLNLPKLGPVTPSVAAQLNSAGTTGLVPALSANASVSLPVASREKPQPAYFAVNPVLGIGAQFVMAGLDNEKTTDFLALPYVSATLNFPTYATLDSESGTYFTFNPSINYLRYIRSSDYGLKVDDKNADGTPDFMRPKTQFYFGVTTGVTFDDNTTFINTGLYYDPFDPSLEKSDGTSVFGYLNIGRSF